MRTLRKKKGNDLAEADDIKKMWQEYSENQYEKSLNNLDNHDDVETHLEPDILESEVKCTLGSITMNKASGGDGISDELLKILKADVKVLHSICQWFGILNNGHKTEKVLIPKITMPENIQATVQLSSFHMLVMLYSKSFKVGFSSM